MKLRTHIIFSLGVTALVSALLHANLNHFLAYSVMAVILQIVIDTSSHEVTRNGYVRRSELFHSVEGGFLLVAITTAGFVFTGAPYGTALPSMVVAVFSHHALDHLTEMGVYVAGKRSRTKLGLKNSDPVANRITSLVGLVMLILAIKMIMFT